MVYLRFLQCVFQTIMKLENRNKIKPVGTVEFHNIPVCFIGHGHVTHGCTTLTLRT